MRQYFSYVECVSYLWTSAFYMMMLTTFQSVALPDDRITLHVVRNVLYVMVLITFLSAAIHFMLSM